MKVGDTYVGIGYPLGAKGPIPFKIIRINENGNVDTENVNGYKCQLSDWFIKYFCKQIASA